MKYLKQFGIILLISFLGEILHRIIPLPVPASIYGILLMLFALQFHIVKLCDVKETGRFLVEIMPVMFIPAAIGLMEVWDVMKPSCFQYLIVILVTTVVVMAVSGLITQFIIRHGKEGTENE